MSVSIRKPIGTLDRHRGFRLSVNIIGSSHKEDAGVVHDMLSIILKDADGKIIRYVNVHFTELDRFVEMVQAGRDWMQEHLRWKDDKAIDMNAEEYENWRKGVQWQYLRQEVLARDKYRCRVCNASGLLDVHHRRYPDALGGENPDDLTTLCRQCHSLFSRYGRLVK